MLPSHVVEALATLAEEHLIEIKMRLQAELAQVRFEVRQLEEAIERKASSQDSAPVVLSEPGGFSANEHPMHRGREISNQDQLAAKHDGEETQATEGKL